MIGSLWSSMMMGGCSGLGWVWWGFGVLFKLMFVVIVVLLLFVGVWIVLLLVVYYDGLLWVSLVVGVLCFLLLLLGWDLLVIWKCY